MENHPNHPFPRRNSNSNFSSKRNPAGNFADVQSDIVISVDGVNFSLHKFPLLSRSGRVRKLAEELNESDSLANPMLEFPNFPGGPDAFELAAKFCYGMNFDITSSNVAHLRCAAEFLEMTEEYGDDNLISRSEAFLEEVIFDNVEKSAQVLHACEGILTWAEEVRIVNRCIDAIASKVCKDQIAYSLTRLEYNSSGRSHKLNNDVSSPLNVHIGVLKCKASVEWWADDLSSLRIDLYQRVLSAMKSRGLRIESIAGSLMHYAQKSLKPLINKKRQGVDSNGSRFKTKAFAYSVVNSKALEHEQRILVESIVSMLPAESNLFPTNFLLTLLRTSIILDTTVACQLDLERRASSQLEHASVDDLLIPTYSNAGDSLFDVEVVQRVLSTYLQQQDESQERLSCGGLYDTDDLGSPSRRGLMKVAKVIDMYLAEIAPDSSLTVSKFLSLAELLPDYSRVIDDGLYRAIDIFLKAHPTVSDLERKKVCKLLDCQKLSQEACTHAAQNERLPVQLVVQVLYFEQLRMRNVMGGPRGVDEEQQQQSPSSGDGGIFYGHGPRPRRMSGGATASPRVDITAHLRSDNRELKLEVARLRLRVNDLEKENAALKQELTLRPAVQVATSANTGSSGFFSMFSRKLGKMNLFSTSTGKPSPRTRSGKQREPKAAPRLRRHSIS